jgi:beta-glucosidase
VAIPSNRPLDPTTSVTRARSIVATMTPAEKAAQLAQVDKHSITPTEVAEYGIGSVLSGGGGNPKPNTPEAWADMVGAFLEAAGASRLGIPILYGADGVHGHSNVVGATIFPHNIGLGAADDTKLTREVYRATALEMAATGARWDFAPTVGVALDARWGRTYEAFGDDAELVAAHGRAAVEGLHGEDLTDPFAVLACVKHYVGDGATEWGTAAQVPWNDWWNGWGTQWHIDQGDTRCDEPTLRVKHLRPYVDAIDAGALTVMASYSSWNGDKLHGHRRLLTDVLKGEMGFPGFVVSDWMGIDQLDPDPYACVVRALGAGIDMVMVPFEYRRFVDNVVKALETGDLSSERVDDAVTRILTVKHALGLFDEIGAAPDVSIVGADPHRALARRAAAASAVLLVNRDSTLPLLSGSVFLAGAGSDDVGLQCGGWTIEWMGGSGPITPGTTIKEGLEAQGCTVTHRPEGDFGPSMTAPVGVVVTAERPYAEGLGDRGDLTLPEEDVALLRRMRTHVDRLVLVVLSGRPLVLDAIVDQCDAIVAGWLPGTEGDGISDILTGRQSFSGRLPRPWPGDRGRGWERGHGITT